MIFLLYSFYHIAPVLLTNWRLVTRLFDSSSQKVGPFGLGRKSLRVSEAPSVSIQAIPTSAVHFCQAGIK